MYNNVYIKESTICKGIGIFSNKRINKNEIITWYYGFITDYKNLNHKFKHNKYIMEYKSINKKKYIVGISDIKKIKGKGFAQLANDAIHYNLTYKSNNSYFIQKKRYIFLIASRNIEKHEEILVSYGIEYWINEINKNINLYNCYFKKIVNILYYLNKLIKDYFLCDVYEIKKIQDNQINFYLTKKRRWCINYNIWHYDEKFYISFKNTFNNNIQIYYSCVTCGDKKYNFEIDKVKDNINLHELNINLEKIKK